MEITLKLTVEETTALMSLLGETPARMGFFPLLGKIQAQGNAQIAAIKALDDAQKTEEQQAA